MNTSLTLGQKLRTRRNALSLKLKDLSEKTGIPLQVISDYENDRKEPGLKNLRLLTKALGVTADSLLFDDEPTVKPSSYGMVLYHYREALDALKEDTITWDKTTDTVSITINNAVIKGVFKQMYFAFQAGGDAAWTAFNFNINLLGSVEIGDNVKL